MSYLTSDYLQIRNKNFLRGHTSISHPLYESDLKNASSCLINFLNKTILSQAKYMRHAYLYNLSAEKCFNNSSNNYSASEGLECEKLLFKKDPILNNIDDFAKHINASLNDQYEKKLNGVECAIEYETKHKAFLLEANYLTRYYFYFIAKDLFTKQ